MTWLLTILVSFLAAGVGLVGAGFIASRCVEWYSIPSREGQSGYYVISLALVGAAAGLALGLIASRIAFAQHLGGWGALGCSLAATIAALGLALLIAFRSADHAPRIHGRPLLLEVEFRSRPGAANPTAAEADACTLACVTGAGRKVQRSSVPGMIRWDQLRREEDRWILPCAAELYTQRGERVITIELSGKREGFLVPLPAWPGERDMQWSDWLPRARPDGGPAVNSLVFRFRVAPLPPPEQGGPV